MPRSAAPGDARAAAEDARSVASAASAASEGDERSGGRFVDTLQRRSVIAPLLEQADEIFRAVKRAAVERNAQGATELAYPLPTSFLNCPLDLATQQLVVYSRVLERVGRAGFTVRLRVREDRSTLLVGWPAALTEAERARMADVIRSHLVEARPGARGGGRAGRASGGATGGASATGGATGAATGATGGVGGARGPPPVR